MLIDEIWNFNLKKQWTIEIHLQKLQDTFQNPKTDYSDLGRVKKSPQNNI